eukprot:6213539-Pleurochrysis_carterae.AAC.2
MADGRSMADDRCATYIGRRCACAAIVMYGLAHAESIVHRGTSCIGENHSAQSTEHSIYI